MSLTYEKLSCSESLAQVFIFMTVSLFLVYIYFLLCFPWNETNKSWKCYRAGWIKQRLITQLL